MWTFFVVGLICTIAIETPVLLAMLDGAHPWQRKLSAALWVNACSYPVVTLALPLLIRSRTPFLWVAETFAPLAECALFYAAFHCGARLGWRSARRDMIAIVAANLLSFGIGAAVVGATG